MQLLRLFVSSTFRDTQAERNILARLVLPRKRAMLSKRATSLQEVDLRWGVTRAMSSDSGAVAICLRELAGCFPVVLGIVGRRAGWTPSREALSAFDAKFAATLEPTTSMTEIELRYALYLADPNAKIKVPILVRSDRLSRSIGFDETQWMASETFRNWALASPAVRTIEYHTFDEFERFADAELDDLLLAQLEQVRPRGVTPTALPELARLRDLTELSRAASGGCPTLVFGKHGLGTSWLMRRWVSEDPGGLYIDGRNVSASDLVKALRESGTSGNPHPIGPDAAGMQAGGFSDPMTSCLLSRLTREPAARRIAFDHFEDAATHEARSEINWIPTKLPRGCSVVIVTRSERLRKQASDLGWRLHDIKAITPDEAVDFAEQYLRAFSKHLERKQVSALRSALWATNFASLVLALDELRRHGTFETLDQRLAELAACSTGVALAKELVCGLTSAMPPEWSRSVEDAILAIRMSLRGLEESEIRSAVGASAYAQGLRELDTPLPSHLWSAIRISLASAFVVRGTLIDVSGGPMLELLDELFVAQPSQVQIVERGLSAALQKEPPFRRWTEAPQLAQLRGGADELEKFLSRPENVEQLLIVGETFAEGWLARLTSPARLQVVSAWEALFKVSDECGIAWKLGLMVARCGETDAGLRLMELGAEAAGDPLRTKDRQSLIAFLKRDGHYLNQLAKELLIVPLTASANEGADIVSGLSILGACADGVVELDRSLERALLTRLTENIRARGDPLLEAQLQVFSGQLLLMRARWFWAARAFARAERIARQLGHARLLCQALERVAAVQIERNRFWAARRAAAECRDLAFRAELSSYEALAFERQIEVERRRANWAAAYELAAAFRARCREGMCDIRRADSALATLESYN
jgi:hypothetical protein